MWLHGWLYAKLVCEATAGFEPAIGVLQTPALPLGHVAIIHSPLMFSRKLQPIQLYVSNRWSNRWSNRNVEIINCLDYQPFE